MEYTQCTGIELYREKKILEYYGINSIVASGGQSGSPVMNRDGIKHTADNTMACEIYGVHTGVNHLHRINFATAITPRKLIWIAELLEDSCVIRSSIPISWLEQREHD